MTSLASVLVRKAVEMREAGRIDEAVITARRATVVDPDDANTWWQLGLAVAEQSGDAAAITYFDKTVEIEEGFSAGWHRLGTAYKKAEMLDDAILSWEVAIEIDEDRVDTLHSLVEAYWQRKSEGDEDRLFDILKYLDERGVIKKSYLNILGVRYHKNKNYFKAIECYRRFAASNDSSAGYFNLGLVFVSPEINQNADAVDSWLRALEQDSRHVKSQKRLDEILPRLIKLRDRFFEINDPLISVDQQYSNYINPFELLNLTDVDDVFELDIKTIQKHKKLLISEIKLEEGRVDWVPDLQIDESKAIKVADMLTDENERYWHHVVFKNKPLLDFMSRGKINHFLVDVDNCFAIETAKEIESWPGEFEALVGENFAAQFNLLLTKAIEKRDVDLIGVLLDGRRWVSLEQADKCFEGAHRKLNEMLKPLQEAKEQSKEIEPSMDGLRAMLIKNNLGKIIKILPVVFQSIQQEAADLVRSISINANNYHDNALLAKQIMEISRLLGGRSASFVLQIDEDTKALDKIIEADREANEAKRIDELLEPLRKASKKSETFKPNLGDIWKILNEGGLTSVLIALPASLQYFQEAVAELIRDIAIDVNNQHDDPVLAKSIIELAKPFVNTSFSVNLKIAEDIEVLDERIDAARNIKEAERIDKLFELLRQATKKSEKIKPRLDGLKEILRYENLEKILINLPDPLLYLQEEAASLMRKISIDTYNLHGDTDLAKDILMIGRSILHANSDYHEIINKDIKTLNENLKTESENEAFLEFQNATYSITRKEVFFNNKIIVVEDVRTLRWSISITRNGGIETYAFNFVVGDKESNILKLSWSSYKNVDTQRALFNKLVDAAFAYLMPRVIEMIKKDLDDNQIIRIGTAPVSRQGVTFTIEGWFSNKQEVSPWYRLQSEIDNGKVIITDRHNDKCKISLPLDSVDNAIALHLMINNQL